MPNSNSNHGWEAGFFTSTCYRKQYYKLGRIMKTNKLYMHFFSNSIVFSLIETEFKKFCAIVHCKPAKLCTIDG